MAVVYFVLLLCGCVSQLCAAICAAVNGLLSWAESIGARGADSGAFFDWVGNFAKHAEGGRGAAVDSGSGALDRGCECVALGDPCGMDPTLDIGLLMGGGFLFCRGGGFLRWGFEDLGMPGEVDPLSRWIDGTMPPAWFE